MKWENRKKKWKINHEYRRVLTLAKIMGEILQEWKEKDMISVVRCKECKHWNSETKGCKRNPSVEEWCDTDYCSYGERREE